MRLKSKARSRAEVRRLLRFMLSLAAMASGLFFTRAVRAQESDTLDPVAYYELRNRGRDALNDERFDVATELFAQLAAINPRNGSIWRDYGIAARSAGREAEALQALEHVYELGVSRSRTARAIAELLARRGDHDGAIAWLERALGDRLPDRSQLLRDSVFAPLRADARFRELAGALPDRRLTRDERWRYDLDYLVREAQRLHKDVERPAFSAEFDAAVQRLHERIPDLADSHIVVELERILTILNDGHSRILRAEAGTATRLPLDLYLFSDGLYVVGAEASTEELLGAQILAFGSLSTDVVLRELEALVPRDNPMGIAWVGPHYLTEPVLLNVIGATDDTLAVTLDIRDRDGLERRVTVQSVRTSPDEPRLRKLPPPFSAPDASPLFLQRVSDAFWLEELPDLEAVYFQYNQVMPRRTFEIQQGRISLGGETVAEFADSLQRTLEQSGARNLIVDVRHNSGGNSGTFPPLVRVLSWFRQTSPEHRIYMLTGRMTFSAAQNFTNIVATLVDPIIVGEPTGSKPTFVGEDSGFRLPYSGVVANVSFRTHQGTIWDDDAIWIAPDVPAELSSRHYFAGSDPVLEAVRALILSERRRHTR